MTTVTSNDVNVVR